MKKATCISLFALCALFGSAQTKQTGNVVEYFGKDKVETTNEGVVVARLDKGLLLPKSAAGGTLFNGQDIIAWLYATDNFRTPRAGDRQPTGSTDAVWEVLDADSSGVFTSRSMRSGFLYTPYDSPRDVVALVETTGGTRTYINGVPHEGDHYDFGYSLVPVRLKKGLNQIVYTPGRFGRVSTKIVYPHKAVQLTQRDMTLPDVIVGEKDDKWASIRIINTTDRALRSMTITATLPDGQSARIVTDDVQPMSVRKVKFSVPSAATMPVGKVDMQVVLRDSKGKIIDSQKVPIQVRTANEHHERTFISKIDGSVQYYSVAPALGGTSGKGLVLSVHGASVEARNQARAYKLKNDVTIVAPTNRRPFGFNWEEWGRIDALEVFEHAKQLFGSDPSRSYLTGHSMGGHGTWFLGTTYPDKFAAIAPCASYPDIITYGSGRGDQAHSGSALFEPLARAANGGRVRDIIQNLAQSGVYVLHGDADLTVPVSQVREMREILSKFHSNFCYYEYPGGSHWYGDHSVDWKPIFEFFARQSIPSNKEVTNLDFHTASPVISASDYWVKVEQQSKAYDFSRVEAQRRGDTLKINSKNVELLTLDLPSLELDGDAVVQIDGSTIKASRSKAAHFLQRDGVWSAVASIDSTRKYAERQGGFKQAFGNNVVLVYATGGTRAENEWWAAKARFDAESFYYKGNGSLEVIADRDFRADRYADRNVVIYGNADNNSAWSTLLAESPIQVHRQAIDFAGERLEGDDLGAYFVAPRPDSHRAMVGVVAGTGLRGARATWSNNYISGITGFAEYMIFDVDILKDGMQGVRKAGFFDNGWSIPLVSAPAI